MKQSDEKEVNGHSQPKNWAKICKFSGEAIKLEVSGTLGQEGGFIIEKKTKDNNGRRTEGEKTILILKIAVRLTQWGENLCSFVLN